MTDPHSPDLPPDPLVDPGRTYVLDDRAHGLRAKDVDTLIAKEIG